MNEIPRYEGKITGKLNVTDFDKGLIEELTKVADTAQQSGELVYKFTYKISLSLSKPIQALKSLGNSLKEIAVWKKRMKYWRMIENRKPKKRDRRKI